MTAEPAVAGSRPERMAEGVSAALGELGALHDQLRVFGPAANEGTGVVPFAQAFPDRYIVIPEWSEEAVDRMISEARTGGPVFAWGPAEELAVRAYPAVRRSVCRERANVKLVVTDAGFGADGAPTGARVLEDIAMFRGLPGMTVVVPADAPSARAATLVLASCEGPGYLRLAPGAVPVVTDGRFGLGEAAELRPGHDVTLVAIGPLVALALETAQALHEVGVEARVLDFASVKPFDEKALLRAARETGAILTLEDQSVLTGLGPLVAATTSENYPIPVRRLGVPDVFAEGSEAAGGRARYGLSKERALEEAWELLRLKGKVQ